jgi:hypothetical protein
MRIHHFQIWSELLLVMCMSYFEITRAFYSNFFQFMNNGGNLFFFGKYSFGFVLFFFSV